MGFLNEHIRNIPLERLSFFPKFDCSSYVTLHANKKLYLVEMHIWMNAVLIIIISRKLNRYHGPLRIKCGFFLGVVLGMVFFSFFFFPFLKSSTSRRA